MKTPRQSSAAHSRRIAMIFGGVSSEHDVSISSASKVVLGLAILARHAHFTLQPIYINREGRWVWAPDAAPEAFPDAEFILAAPRWEFDHESLGIRVLAFHDALARLVNDKISTALLVLHGQNGEDGRLQGALDLAGIPYSGSGAAASALAFDKPKCQAVLSAAGVPIAPSVSVSLAGGGQDGAERILKLVGLPCVVKPARGGSSVGVTIVNTAEELLPALHCACEVDEEIMAERYVRGREFSCGVLEKEGAMIALPITEIIPPEGRFYDYEVKYTAGMCREVTPAEIAPGLAVKIQTLSRAAHRACGCHGFSRVDFIADPADPVVLEINTLPGMTATSLLPQGAAAHGISFPELLGLMLESARCD